MKLLFDLLPVILFFATYKFASHGSQDSSCLSTLNDGVSLLHEPILLATMVAILATAGQVAWLLARGKKVDTMLWASLGIIVVLGGATLYFRNPEFIQWKPTVLYWSFGITLLVTERFFGKNLIQQAMMAQQIELPASIWIKLNAIWAIFFVVQGIINIIVAHQLSCDGWVSFKLYGSTGIMLVFMVLQGFWLNKYLQQQEKN